MNLDIKGRHALVCAASQGLGRAAALALAREGVNLTIVARRQDILEETAQMIRDETGVLVTTVATDITTEAGRLLAVNASPVVDILVNGAGGIPPGDFRNFNRDEWMTAIEGLMLTPIELIKATIDGMVERRFGRIINITSKGMRVPSQLHPLANGARGGLTAFVSTIAAEYSQHNVTINNLLPGPFDTDRMKVMTQVKAESSNRTFEEQFKIGVDENPARRWGRPEEFGAVCTFLCSSFSGFITGQNILIDGGSAPTTF